MKKHAKTLNELTCQLYFYDYAHSQLTGESRTDELTGPCGYGFLGIMTTSKDKTEGFWAMWNDYNKDLIHYSLGGVESFDIGIERGEHISHNKFLNRLTLI